MVENSSQRELPTAGPRILSAYALPTVEKSVMAGRSLGEFSRFLPPSLLLLINLL
jgi:hypothetical protein